jgi:hypothetical protein
LASQALTQGRTLTGATLKASIQEACAEPLKASNGPCFYKDSSMLSPVLALITWTFVIWVWMYATRLPAMQKARIDARIIKRKEDLDSLPVGVKQVADNYNHLHEQPTLFYALAFYSHLVGIADSLNVTLAWSYVGLRIVHSCIQCTFNFVPLRFVTFVAGSLVLMVLALRNALAMLP